MTDRNKGFDYIGVGVSYFCHDGNGNVILAKRSQNARDEHGRWDIGSGAIEFDDSVEQTLYKEIKEEFGVDVLSFEFLGYRDVHRTHEDQLTHWVMLDFKVLIDPTNLILAEPEKFTEIGLFTLEYLPQPLHSQLPNFLSIYKNRLQK